LIEKIREIRYKINPEVVAMGLAVRSLYLATQYIPLSDAEAQAIAYHDGQYIDDNQTIAHKEEPLTLLLRWAFINSCRKTHKFACGMNGIRSERVFLEGGSPLMVERASPSGLSAVY
jgi:hypothetical protein